MTPDDVLARTLWAEDRGGGADGMEAIAGVIMNRVSEPGWWGHDAVGVCLAHGQFDGWNWSDPNFRPMLTVDEGDKEFAVALIIAKMALRGDPIERASGATHYYAKSMHVPPGWASIDGVPRTPCFETKNHRFFKIGLSA